MNGIGKSTLLKTMLGKIAPLSGKVERGDFLYPSYFEQEVKAGNITPIEMFGKRILVLNNTKFAQHLLGTD